MDKSNETNNGFTIVEILIVIVVIVILATITLVSYVGVQKQTKQETTKANAASVKKAAEAYYNTKNVYPTQVAHFKDSFVNFPSEITLLKSGSLTSANGEYSIMYRYVSSGAGACIARWDFLPASGSPGAVVVDRFGSATTGNCSATVGTFPT